MDHSFSLLLYGFIFIVLLPSFLSFVVFFFDVDATITPTNIFYIILWMFVNRISQVVEFC